MPKPREHEGQFRSLLRAFVNTFPPLKIALYINDLICYLFSRLVDGVSWLLRNSLKFTLFISNKIFGPVYELVASGFSRLISAIPVLRDLKQARGQAQYERLGEKEPIPYSNQLIKRSITYHGGLLLALSLYIFIYFVLVKHHTYSSISIAFLLLLLYLILIENSHRLRSILMLCLPIMFTNRGRALVFCSMLALLSSGPMKGLQHNVQEIHASLNCCKQYLAVRTDKYVGERVVDKLVRLEQVVLDLVDNMKMFARELRDKFDGIIQLALITEQFVVDSVRKLKQILNLCNLHTRTLNDDCLAYMSNLFAECQKIANSFGLNMCKALNKLKGVCNESKLPDVFCELPQYVVEFLERTIGRKLAEYVEVIENEFYVDVDVKRQFDYEVIKNKSFAKVASEIRFDVEQKFWYVHLIRRIFNLISLILVIWIFSTATIYHARYLSELEFDNMYLDERLNEIEDLRKMGADYLFPMTPAHERHYLKPFSLRMNKTELSKVYWSGLVWLLINGYIFFFLLLDFAFYSLVHFLVETLREILFTSDLPLVDLETKSHDASGETSVVRYNRTYLADLRKERLAKLAALAPSNDSLASTIESHKQNRSVSSIRDFYDRLMFSVERDIPDDVAILESLEECLPAPQVPTYSTYKLLVYLALFTFCAVIVEAYALRTRHCIANLYYPRRARRRAFWLYRKLLSEKPKFREMELDEGNLVGQRDERPRGSPLTKGRGRAEKESRRERGRRQALDIGFKLLDNAIKR